MLIPQKTKDVSRDDTILTLNKAEWDNFQKELSQPKPATKEFKELMANKDFNIHSSS